MEKGVQRRSGIIRDFAKWTALSATRSGAPIKSRAHVYGVLETVRFDIVLDGETEIDAAEFDRWHERMTTVMLHDGQPLITGWAVKLLNVYLKTAAYVGDLGRPGLRSVLHPPIDGGLWVGLQERFQGDAAVLGDTNHVSRIKDITDYASYQRIINGCRVAARKLGCDLIELEQLWTGTQVPGSAA